MEDTSTTLMHSKRINGLGVWVCILWIFTGSVAVAGDPNDSGFMTAIEALASPGDRSTGTAGCREAARYIQKVFMDSGFEPVGSQTFSVPVVRHEGSRLSIPDRDETVNIHPFRYNAVSPQTIPAPGLEAPLVYGGSGTLADLNGRAVADTVILLEPGSGKNWLSAANLGAAAVLYVDRGNWSRPVFQEKTELTPIDFPCFLVPVSQLRRLFGSFETAPEGRVAPRIRLTSDTAWDEVIGANIYGWMPGIDPELSNELILVEAFYDSTAMVPGRSPGADEACGIATLLTLARHLKDHPPGRTVLLVATGGHAQTLAGMRETIWSIATPSKHRRRMQKQLKSVLNRNRDMLEAVRKATEGDVAAAGSNELFRAAVTERIKTEVDLISRRLMRLRMDRNGTSHRDTDIQRLTERRLLLRRLDRRSTFADLSRDERAEIMALLPRVILDRETVVKDAERRLDLVQSAARFRSLVSQKDLKAVISLHLSSHGDGVGAFNDGSLYALKPTIHRTEAYSTIDEVLTKAARRVEAASGLPEMFQDTLRPNRLRPRQSYLPDEPFLGGEVSAVAGYLGVTLATLHDARAWWGTPGDQMDNLDTRFADRQSQLVTRLICELADARILAGDKLPRLGYAEVTGQANFIRHGELFADQPAPGTILMCYQGRGRYYARVDAMGRFYLHGVADKKHVLDKVIIEGYRFDPATGSVVWAIDKKQTGKDAYRVKMRRRFMETDLVMFACRQTTVFNLLEPRNFNYLTKVQLIDGRREAPPMRYWYSRIDTRDSVIASVYLESGTPLKMTLSDSLLTRKLILTRATDIQPVGTGYRVDQWPYIHLTEFRTARDMWALLGPRIRNLERHGIIDEKIRRIRRDGEAALARAGTALAARAYDRFFKEARRSWALANRVYDHVDSTQQDVLLGVLFYIALFVPFSFAMERLLFSFADIHKRIVAFLGILGVLIVVIYLVHPAFELAYSPTVVILAFFIMGLSLMVTLIIFFRFEQEMSALQRRAKPIGAEEISRWKAFSAAFFLGVGNLRRRRLRTGLTCLTLMILTFTIMSFTSVKTIRRHSQIRYQTKSAYTGILMKHANWKHLPRESLDMLSNAFRNQGVVLPRVWLEHEDRTQRMRVPIRCRERVYDAGGLVGLGAREIIRPMAREVITGGRWFREHEGRVVLLPDRLARYLGIDPDNLQGASVRIWGQIFDVIGTFSADRYQTWQDLDGEPLTPVTFPSELTAELTEVEKEAMESGEDVRAFQSRYQHTSADQIVIVPYRTLLAMGGHFKALAVVPDTPDAVPEMARRLVDRFGLTLFAGQPDGTYVYNVSDRLNYSGMPNVVVPLLISALIVLNTMIGSVYERKREIAVYTSVGLAPSHVAFLFVAEAVAFAVISVVFGYILAQTTAVLFAGTPLWAGITVNYSSLAGVAAMMLVLIVVLVSVIYPSRTASRIAIPDVTRAWTLPQPVGNVLSVTLPFLMKFHENRSVGAYLYVYFRDHRDVSHGTFSTGDIAYDFVCPVDARSDREVHECRLDCFRFRGKVWLAPFDFGIMQQVELMFYPSFEDPGYLEIRVRLTRLSGEINSWRRINRTFLHQLRKQLLIWRSLEDSVRHNYERLLERAEEKAR